MCALLSEPNPVGREHRIDLWVDETPVLLTEAKTKVLSKQGNDRFLAQATLGEVNANVTLDKSSGMPAAAEIKMGPLEMKLERVYVNGSL